MQAYYDALFAQCDLAVATRESRFAVSGVNLRLVCSTPSVSLIPLFYLQLEVGLQAAYVNVGRTMACNMMNSSAREGA
jgi:hypothetical protein